MLQDFNYGQGIIGFLTAYVIVSVIGFVVYLLISKQLGTSPWDEVEVKDNKAYALTKKFLPLLNLIIWSFATWLFFNTGEANYTNALILGGFWLVLAVVVDYIGFVLVKHPLSVDAKSFYIDQSPWIYLTYLAVFLAPLCYVALAA